MAQLRIKRGTEAQTVSGTLAIGELAFATDTCSVWSYNGITKCVVGRAIVDIYTNLTTYDGSSGRFFYASDTEQLYIHDGSDWIATGGGVTLSQLTATSGNIVSQIPSLAGYATQSWSNGQFITPTTLSTVSGNIVTQIPSLAGYATQGWVNGLNYITSASVSTISGNIISQIPSLTGYATQSWVSGLGYITTTTVNTISGNIVSQIPSLTGYATQAWVNGQIPSLVGYATQTWVTSQIPSLAGYATQAWSNGQYYTQAQISTISGSIVSQIPSLTGYATQSWANGQFVTSATLSTISGNIISQIPSLAGYATQAWVTQTISGTGYSKGSTTFGGAGSVTIAHNLNNANHYTGITATVTNITDAAKFGTPYVIRDANVDTVYTSAGSDASGLSFAWIAQGLPQGTQTYTLGSGIFSQLGTSVTHSLGDTNHTTSITPTVTNNDDASKIGTIYVTNGTNSDTVYMTGGPTASGLSFMWLAQK